MLLPADIFTQIVTQAPGSGDGNERGVVSHQCVFLCERSEMQPVCLRPANECSVRRDGRKIYIFLNGRREYAHVQLTLSAVFPIRH